MLSCQNVGDEPITDGPRGWDISRTSRYLQEVETQYIFHVQRPSPSHKSAFAIEPLFNNLIMSALHVHAERSPLLPKVKTSEANFQGCHEISPSTKYCILGALWAGTFLCVSSCILGLLLRHHWLSRI